MKNGARRPRPKPKTKEVMVVTCSSGIELVTKPVSVKLLEMFELNHREPEPPMIEAEVIGGEIDMVPNPDDPAYQEAKLEFNRKATSDFLSLLFDFGVDVELPENDSWERKLKRTGVAIPEDEDEKRAFYIQTIAMTDFMGDLQLIASSVLRQSGVGEEAIASWVDLF